jgi:hypothetical protein
VSGIDLEVSCHIPFYAVEISDESAEARRQLRLERVGEKTNKLCSRITQRLRLRSALVEPSLVQIERGRASESVSDKSVHHDVVLY